ncbi:MAG: PHP domain-containing protein [Oscillospiraceae bacterium]|nr:PHP domain-containing protein [Oscillospiraceae bacterium]
MTDILDFLNTPAAGERLERLAALLEAETAPPVRRAEFSNNHIHTIYSFSPYSPAAAVYFARAAGLPTAGIMDHDSVAGAAEFREAGTLAGIGVTCGFECRARLDGTFLEKLKVNNPDQAGVAYMAMHSVRARYFNRTQETLAPLRERRNLRSRAMTERAAEITGFDLDFDADVVPLSRYAEGGAVTERHILYALAGKLGTPDSGNPYWRYDLLGRLKTELLPQIYIPAGDELLSLDELVSLAREIDAILCYAYLGDVTVSATGDKAAARYEDGFLEALLRLMKERGVAGVTFMPSRNTPKQLKRLMALCVRYGFTQISGEDINSPRQGFLCDQLTRPEFRHLVDEAWRMVRREEEDDANADESGTALRQA